MALESWAKSERASGLFCPDYKLVAGMEAERSIGKIDNNPDALKEAASVNRDSRIQACKDSWLCWRENEYGVRLWRLRCRSAMRKMCDLAV